MAYSDVSIVPTAVFRLIGHLRAVGAAIRPNGRPDQLANLTATGEKIQTTAGISDGDITPRTHLSGHAVLQYDQPLLLCPAQSRPLKGEISQLKASRIRRDLRIGWW
jgi:hypothetical protein